MVFEFLSELDGGRTRLEKLAPLLHEEPGGEHFSAGADNSLADPPLLRSPSALGLPAELVRPKQTGPGDPRSGDSEELLEQMRSSDLPSRPV